MKYFLWGKDSVNRYGFCICKFTYSLKFIYNPKSILLVLSQSVTDMCKLWKLSPWRALSLWVLIRQSLAFLFLLSYCKCVLLPCFSHRCAFCWWFCHLKWPPSVVLKCCLRVRWLTEKIRCWISFLQACVTALSAVSSILMSQRYRLNKLSLNRNTHKTRLYTDWLMKLLGPGAHKNLTLCFPKERWCSIH